MNQLTATFPTHVSYDATLQSAFSSHPDLSHSPYDIAMVALVPGPHRSDCLRWLLEHRQADHTWGVSPRLCWYDTYVCTYAAAVALAGAGYADLAAQAFASLPGIVQRGTGTQPPETLTFGGIVETLDRVCAMHGLPAIEHDPQVQRIVFEERQKWQYMIAWDRFYDPAYSIAGYCGERIYGDERIDLQRFLASFQTENGSIANSPAASALVLLECHRRQAVCDYDRLHAYVTSQNPYMHSVGYLDWVPHFVTAWSVMYMSELGSGYLKNAGLGLKSRMNAMYGDLYATGNFSLLCPVGRTTIPGDTDSTACALLALYATGYPLPRLDPFDGVYDRKAGLYQTFRFERNASVSTNIHMAGLLALYPTAQLDPILDWLEGQVNQARDVVCKWHVSPIYTAGEMARILAHIAHPKSYRVAVQAGNYLLQAQNGDGGWGINLSTSEETGYAVLGLAALYDAIASHPRANFMDRALLYTIEQSLCRAECFLRQTSITHAPLWLGKSLYCVEPLVPVLHTVGLERIRQVTQTDHRQAFSRLFEQARLPVSA